MPEPAWALFAQDDFTGVQFSDVDNRLMDDGSGHKWSVTKGSALIDLDRFRITPPSPQGTIARVDMGVFSSRADGKMRVVIEEGSNRIGVFGRMDKQGKNYIVALLDAPYVYVFNVIDNTHTVIGNVSLAGQAPDVSFGLSVFGSTIRVLDTDENVVLELTNGDISSAGNWGIYVSSPAQYVESARLYLPSGFLSTPVPTTMVPTTPAPTTEAPPTPTTPTPTTLPEPTFPPTTVAPTTTAPTTPAPTTPAPTTTAPTTIAPTTDAPVPGEQIRAEFSYVSERDRLVCRAWAIDSDGTTRLTDPDLAGCTLRLVDEVGGAREVAGAVDAETGVVRFVVPQARLYSEHLYLVRIVLDDVGPALFPLAVN